MNRTPYRTTKQWAQYHHNPYRCRLDQARRQQRQTRALMWCNIGLGFVLGAGLAILFMVADQMLNGSYR
jgi:hypothetical protein